MAELCLLLITLVWGTTFSLIKDALVGASAAGLLLARFAIATAVLAVVAVSTRRRAGTDRRALLRDGTILGVLLAVGFFLQTEGLVHTTPARSAFFTGLTVLFVPFVAALLYRRRIAPRAWTAALVAACGLAFLTHPASRAAGATMLGGDLLSFGCAVAFAFHIVLTGEWSGRHHLVTLTLVEIAAALVLIGLYGLVRPPLLPPTPAFWVTVLFLGAAVTAGSFLLQNWAQRHVDPVRAALIFTLEPVAASAFAWVYRGDRLSVLEAAGGALVIAGVVLGEVGGALVGRKSA
jgi:drug/metabolite transporter (DMT)-like permease